MKLSVMLNYSGDVIAAAEEVSALEKAGLDCAWVAEAYSFDAISMMGYLAGQTERVEIGSAIVNVYSRTATLLAMTFAGLDAISAGRINCGLGASGPQVIEGFHGVAYEKPMQRIKETIEVCRSTWRREVIDYHGKTIDIPLPADEGTGLGKPLKLINHPVRDSIPVWWASLKGLSVEATAEVADGWIPVFFVPELADRVWGDALAVGTKKRLSNLGPLQTLAGGAVTITDDRDLATRVLDRGRAQTALYVGGMGARGKNFYNDIMSAYGWEGEAKIIQDLYLDGKKSEAEAAIPMDYLEASALVGPIGHIKDRLVAYKEAGVTHLQMGLGGSIETKMKTVETMRELVDQI
ncbi:MAG: LLM class F420-dependent oxidoreductase [Actinomycetes bacterium]